MVKIKYVGAKDQAPDMWYGSGKTWNGKGDVQEVADLPAKKLLVHTDEFALADEADAGKVAEAGKVTVMPEATEPGQKLEPVTLDLAALESKPVEKMDKLELEAFARHKFGKELDRRRSRKVLADEVQAMVNGALPHVLAGGPDGGQ